MQLLARIFVVFGIGLSVSSVKAQDSIQALNGEWHSIASFCSSVDLEKVRRTKIFKVPGLDFEPVVKLTIFDTEKGKNLTKSVETKSCQASTVNGPDFLESTYAINVRPEVIQGQTIYEMNPTALLSSKVNSSSIRKCGTAMHGAILDALLGMRYPKYFQTELARVYNIRLVGRELYLRFIEPEICGDSPTVMVFRLAE